MATAELIRAWSDPQYRAKLGEIELTGLAPHPAGDLEAELAQLNGPDGGGPLMATTSTCTCTQNCTATASVHSSRPCCC